MKKRLFVSWRSLFIVLAISVGLTNAQTTAFTYQGRLTDTNSPPTANYDFEFRLFDAMTAGTQQGTTQTLLAVPVTGGTFTVQIDFGNQFPGANRFLEIRVRMVGQPSFVPLSPRQLLGSAPYSVKSLNTDNAITATNATQLGGVAANQYVLTTDPRMSDARNPLPNSANYIQNTLAGQAGNFNISGTGTATAFDAGQYRIGGVRVLSVAGANNLFVGIGAGTANSAGSNSFVGSFAGELNTSGGNNSFFGFGAGRANTVGAANSFFGSVAGVSNTSGIDNAFFGSGAGQSNTTGTQNSFFGRSSGIAITAGNNNSFFGTNAGSATTTGTSNAFFGQSSGDNNVTGFANTLIGTNAEVGAPDLQFATAIGADSVVLASNSMVLGRSNGSDSVLVPGALTVSGTLTANLPSGDSDYIQNTLAGQAANFNISGIGTATAFNAGRYDIGGNRVLSNAGSRNLFAGVNAGVSNTAADNAFFGFSAGQNNTTGSNNAFFGSFAGTANQTGAQNAFFGTYAGNGNTSGGSNSFFGNAAGLSNTSGSENSFFGESAGFLNTTGLRNSFFGRSAGASNSIGMHNSFFGYQAGLSNTGSFNSLFGSGAGRNSTFGGSNSFFGWEAGGSTTSGGSNSFFGTSSGFSNTTGAENAFFGDRAGFLSTASRNSFFGNRAGESNTSGENNTFVGRWAGINNTTGNNNTFIGVGAGNPNTSTQVNNSTAIGYGATTTASNQIVLGSTSETTWIPGHLRLIPNPNLSGSAVRTFVDSLQSQSTTFAGISSGAFFQTHLIAFTSETLTHMCKVNRQMSDGTLGWLFTVCLDPFSSGKDKSDAKRFSGGLDIIKQLKPINFKWKDGGGNHYGLNAEDVAAVQPSLVNVNDKGETETVKKGVLEVLFINAFKEQQAQIEGQKEKIEALERQIAALKTLVCSQNVTTDICKP